ncbi:hypothetical protein CYMTET_46502 [Cymbomonas tetramitiformis]|uniref:RING-type domain-containing protein n=1 Tax=Cymbomonas tetramitiformis TaxID=36881 RepID=A0AAE0BXX8_9CHLO|nr:hypothetical protein CYMTET_46502 [Cymbomonas tetramitiformis]
MDVNAQKSGREIATCVLEAGPSHSKRIPITLLSGYCGADKVTVLEYLIRSSPSLKVGAVVSQDLLQSSQKSEDLVRQIKLLLGDDVVYSYMKCVWHWATHPDGIMDCLMALLKKARAKKYTYDRIVIVSAARAEPSIILNDFLEPWCSSSKCVVSVAAGVPSSDYTHHDELISAGIYMDQALTVVDAARFLPQLESTASHFCPQMSECDGHRFGVADLLLEQVECADMVILTKYQGLDQTHVKEVKATVSALNPDVPVVLHNPFLIGGMHPFKCPKLVCNSLEPVRGMLWRAASAAREMEQVQAALEEDAGGGAIVEPESFKQFVYLQRKPFHSTRLWEYLQSAWLPEVNLEAENLMEKDDEHRPDRRSFPLFVYPAKPQLGLMKKIVRSKGLVWLDENWKSPGIWSQSPVHLEVNLGSRGMQWFAQWKATQWEDVRAHREAMLADFGPTAHRSCGDRRTEIVFVASNQDFDFKALKHGLDSCLMTQQETKRMMLMYECRYGLDPANPIITAHRVSIETKWAQDQQLEKRRAREEKETLRKVADEEQRAREGLREEEKRQKEEEAATKLEMAKQKESAYREEQKQKAASVAAKRKEKLLRKRVEKAAKAAEEEEERQDMAQIQALAQWYREKRKIKDEQHALAAVLRRVEPLLAELDLCRQQPWHEARLTHDPKPLNEACPVCLVDFVRVAEVRTLPCGHVSCRSCIDMWFDHNAAELVPLSCPLCRTPIGCSRIGHVPVSCEPEEPSPSPAPPGSKAEHPSTPPKTKPCVDTSNGGSQARSEPSATIPEARKPEVPSVTAQPPPPPPVVASIMKHEYKPCATVRFKEASVCQRLIALPPWPIKGRRGTRFLCSLRVATVSSGRPLRAPLFPLRAPLFPLRAPLFCDNPTMPKSSRGMAFVSWVGHAEDLRDREITQSLSATYQQLEVKSCPGSDVAICHTMSASSVVSLIKKSWTRPSAIVTFKQASVCQSLIALARTRQFEFQGSEVRCHEHTTKAAHKDPSSLFMTWMQGHDFSEADLAAFADAVCADPAAHAPVSAAPTHPPPQAPRPIQLAAGGEEVTGGGFAGATEASQPEEPKAKAVCSSTHVARIRKAWKKPSAIVEFRSARLRDAVLEHAPDLVLGVPCKRKPHEDARSGVTDPNSLFFTWSWGYELTEEEIVEFMETVLMSSGVDDWAAEGGAVLDTQAHASWGMEYSTSFHAMDLPTASETEFYAERHPPQHLPGDPSLGDRHSEIPTQPLPPQMPPLRDAATLDHHQQQPPRNGEAGFPLPPNPPHLPHSTSNPGFAALPVPPPSPPPYPCTFPQPVPPPLLPGQFMAPVAHSGAPHEAGWRGAQGSGAPDQLYEHVGQSDQLHQHVGQSDLLLAGLPGADNSALSNSLIPDSLLHEPMQQLSMGSWRDGRGEAGVGADVDWGGVGPQGVTHSEWGSSGGASEEWGSGWGVGMPAVGGIDSSATSSSAPPGGALRESPAAGYGHEGHHSQWAHYDGLHGGGGGLDRSSNASGHGAGAGGAGHRH